MKILLAQHAGSCYGVERALHMVEQAVDSEVPTFTLGPLIHNPQVVAELERRRICEVGSVEDVQAGNIVIRSHGVAPQVIAAARVRGLTVVDATCPHVKKAQEAARQLAQSGRVVVIVGEPGHPEVEAIEAYAGGGAIVAASADDLPERLPSAQVGVVVQTTQSEHSLNAVVRAIAQHGTEPLVKNTICFATRQRQQAAAQLAKDAQVMVVVGGRNSGNTTRLYEICQEVCPQTYHIEQTTELDPAWFAGVGLVGLTAGASTPQNQIDAVLAALEAM